MHSPEAMSGNRTLALAVALLMIVPSLWAVVGPSGAVLIEGVEGGALPLEWAFPSAGDSATFDVSLPAGGHVTDARLTLEGATFHGSVDVNHTVADWEGQPSFAGSGLAVGDGALGVATEDAYAGVRDAGLKNFSEATDVVVLDGAVRLAPTSPSFSASGGGSWKYYRELDVSLNLGTPVYDALTFMPVDFPVGHCKEVNEIRVMDFEGREVPFQFTAVQTDSTSGSVTYVQMLLPTDMPARGSNPYRVYYGNPSATSPGYKPIILANEVWDYTSTADVNFRASWAQLPWSGGNTNGASSADIITHPVMGKVFHQKTSTDRDSTFSQVWTSRTMDYDDFQLELFFGNTTLAGPRSGGGMWGVDFRVQGTDCYRFAYADSLGIGKQATVGLYRVSTTRHLETQTTVADHWRTLALADVDPSGLEVAMLIIRAEGRRITVWINDLDQPVLEAVDPDITKGYIGTFQAAQGAMLAMEPTTVTGAYGQMVAISTAVNLTSKSAVVRPHEERMQNTLAGTYVSETLELEGARDTFLNLDVSTPQGTHYTVDLLAPDGTARMKDLRDGSAIPEGALDGGFRLGLRLGTDKDWVTPRLEGWGVGYRAPLRASTGGDGLELTGLVLAEGGLQLAPTRNTWYKHDDPVFERGHFNPDESGVSIGCYVPYADGWRLYYTGRDRWGVTSICMAYTLDGLTFTDFEVVLRGTLLSAAWDARVSSPWVMRTEDGWIMFYVGKQSSAGSIGFALSGDGVTWTRNFVPILSPTGQPGDLDKESLEDVFVMKEPGTDTLHMYYTGKPAVSAVTSYIFHAMSTTVVLWTRDSKAPVVSPSSLGSAWDAGYVADPYVVLTPNGTQVMYYRGGAAGSPAKPASVGLAYSADWVKFNKPPESPVLIPRQGGIADDMLGISGYLVLEGGRNRYYILYSAFGSDASERAFVADSGHVKDGSVQGPMMDLLRAPRALGPMLADVVIPLTTSVKFFVRSSEDMASPTPWQEVVPGKPHADLVPPGRYVQLRVDLHTSSTDTTPLVVAVFEAWRSNVREAMLDMGVVLENQYALVDAVADIVGERPDSFRLEASTGADLWVDLTDGTLRQFAEPGAHLLYRIGLEPAPGDAMAIHHINITAGWPSDPAGVMLDVGDDGTDDWEHEGVLLEPVEANVTVALRAELAEASTSQEEGSAVVIPIRVSTSAPGVLGLTGIVIRVDTPPRIVSRSPAEDPSVEEGEAVNLSVAVGQDDGDALVYEWRVDGGVVEGEGGPTLSYVTPTEPNWSARPPLDVRVTVSDGRFSRSTNWSVQVIETPPPPPPPPVNKAPVYDSWVPTTSGITIDENASAVFEVFATDPDSGPMPVTYRWYVNDTLRPLETGRNMTWRTTYADAGTYTVRVEAFDGEAGVNRTWTLTVRNASPPTPPPPPPDVDGDEGGWPAWMLPTLLILILVILGVVGAYAMSRRRGAPAAGPSAIGPEPVEVDLEAAALPSVGTAAPPAEGAGTVQHGLGASTAAKGAAAGAAIAPIAPLPILDMEKDRTFVVEEVYVVYNDGRLVHHACRDDGACGVDTDLFGGMFTAIQQFIHDSMGSGRPESPASQVGRLDYGENAILVERGKYLFLAVIIYGEDRPVLRDAVRDVLNRIEGAYAGVIERWSGDQTQLAGVADFVAPLIGLTADITRDTITTRTVEEGVKMLSEVEFYQGYVRLKVALRNDTRKVITNAAVDISYDTNVLKVQRIQPEYDMLGTKVQLGTLAPREKKTVAYYLDPLICQESDIDGTATFKDAEGRFGTVTMKRRRADIVCPIFFTEENANTAMLKRLISEELKQVDSKLFNIPKILTAKDAFVLAKQVIRGHDVRFVREFVEEAPTFRAEAWFYGVTKVKKNKMVIRTSVWEDRKNVEFSVASNRVEAITGLLAELGQNLNEALKEKYMGRARATPVIDEGEREAVKDMGLLIDKYSESEVEAGEVDQS